MNAPTRIITPRETDALARRVREYGTMTTRELRIFLDGIADGMDIKADQVQPVISNLEFQLMAVSIPIS